MKDYMLFVAFIYDNYLIAGCRLLRLKNTYIETVLLVRTYNHSKKINNLRQ